MKMKWCAISFMAVEVIKILQMVHHDVHDDVQTQSVRLRDHGSEILQRAEPLIQ